MEGIEVTARIINIYPVGSEVSIVVFETAENWVLRGVAKTSSEKIEYLIDSTVRIRYRQTDGRELGNIEQIEVIGDAED